MKVTFRIPSKGVQYGYVEVDVEHEGNWEELGQYYYGVVKGFQAGEAIAKNGRSSAKVEDVLPPPAYEESITEAMVYAALGDNAPEDVQAAAEQMLIDGLGATNITDVMNEDVEEETPEWEKPPPPPSDDDWDF